MDVTVRCLCPGTPHESDTITLRERLDFRSVSAIRYAIGFLEDSTNPADVLAVLSEGYILYGIERWSLRDEHGKPLPVTRANITEYVLSDMVAAADVSDAADTLYSEAVTLPLLVRASRSSQPSQTAGSTSAKRPSSVKRPTPSKRSSTTTSRTDGIAMTSPSPAGVSSSSPSSASVS